MRRLYTWAAAAAVALLLGFSSCCEPKEKETPTLITGSYNIWCGVSEEGDNPWSKRFLRLRDLIRFYEYDLLGMQEVRPEQLELFRTMEEYDVVGTGREGPGQSEHMTILYRTSRLELLDSATFWLSPTPEEVSIGWDAAYNRICTWARFRDLADDGREFFFFNTHFDHMGEVAKLESAKLLTARIAEITSGYDLPIICTGDFNSFPQSEPIRVMKSMLRSAREASVEPAYNAYETFRGNIVGGDPPAPVLGEIDYVFVNGGVEVLKYGVLTDNNGRFYPSDHLALWVKVQFKESTVNTTTTTSSMKKAIIRTEKGDMTVELFDQETPITAGNFIDLSKKGFYDGLTFHRVIPDFVIQGGCPDGTGVGGPGYTIKCETSAPRQYHDRGVLSMAHRGKDTGGSQFFICHSRNNTAHLDGVHTCFGQVIEGLDVIDQIRQGDEIISIEIVENQ